MSIQNSYDNWSSSYDEDENLTRDLDRRVTEKTLRDLQPKRILEIGCGTGKNTAFLAQIGDMVHALDFSEGMITSAREKVKAENVLFSVADLTKSWPDDAASVDLVVCNLVLEHIKDIVFIFSQASRSLCPQGLFFVSELHPFRQYQGKKAKFQSHEGTVEIPAYVHHISDFLNAAGENGFSLKELREWWHEKDQDKPPRLISFLFEKQKI
jgi:ubiquinone/menaquinone biosynthesis C-methylase UbiE